MAFQEHQWESVASGLWDDAGNWRFDTVPGQNVATFINPKNGLQIAGPSGPVQVVSLTIGAQQSGVAELRLQPNGHFIIETALTVQSGGKLLVNGVVNAAGTVTNMGEIELVPGAQLNGDILGNTGAVRGAGVVGNILQNLSGGEVRASAGQRLFFSGAGNTNAGDIEVIGGEVEFSGDLTNSVSTGLIAGENATFRFDGGLTSNGAVVLSFGTSRVFGDVANSATGVIAVAGNSQVTFYDDMANSGVLNVVNGSTAVFLGALTGNGNSGGGDVQALGNLVPGASPGVMNFSGNLTMGPLTNLFMELGGTSPGTYDRIQVAGDLSLDGMLDMSILPGFTPSDGQSFNILDWGNLDSEFIQVNLPTLDGLKWDTSQLYTTGALSLTASDLPGDYNLDGSIDGTDFLKWQRGESPNSLSESDLAIWQTNYGMDVPPASASIAVPESRRPGTLRSWSDANSVLSSRSEYEAIIRLTFSLRPAGTN